MPTDLPALLAVFGTDKWHARGPFVYRSSNPEDTRQVCRVPASAPPNRPHPIAAFVAAAQNELPSILAELTLLRSQASAALDVTSDALRVVRDETQKLRAEHMVATIARAALLEIASLSPDPEDGGKACLDKLLRAVGIAHEAIVAIGTEQETT